MLATSKLEVSACQKYERIFGREENGKVKVSEGMKRERERE